MGTNSEVGNSLLRGGIAVFIGAAAGTAIRAAIGIYVGTLGGHVGINILGSLLLGVLLAALPEDRHRRQRELWGTGFLGGFTTYSAFTIDAWSLLESGSPWLAAGYIGLSVVGGLLAALAGCALGARLRRSSRPGSEPRGEHS